MFLLLSLGLLHSYVHIYWLGHQVQGVCVNIYGNNIHLYVNLAGAKAKEFNMYK